MMVSKTTCLAAGLLLGLTLTPALAPAFEGESGLLRRIDDDTFHLSLVDDAGATDLPEAWRAGFHVRLDGVRTDGPTSIEIDRLVWPYPFMPVFSYDQRAWQPFADASLQRPTPDTLSIAHRFASPTVWIAQRQPFGSAELAGLCARLRAGAGEVDAVEVDIESLGTTPEGRAVTMVTLGDASASVDRRRVWVHARVHPGEPQASFMAAGLLEFLAGPAPGARAARSRFVFHVVPVLNVDGVARGHYRTNASGENLESLWDVAHPPGEIVLVRAAIDRLRRAGPDFVAALNLHSSHAPSDQAPFTFPHFGPEALGYAPDEARLWKQQLHFAAAVGRAARPLPFAATWGGEGPLPAPAGSQFLQVPMPERWWWQALGPEVLALTVEAVDGRVGRDGRWATGDDARAIGHALVQGLLEAVPPT